MREKIRTQISEKSNFVDKTHQFYLKGNETVNFSTPKMEEMNQSTKKTIANWKFPISTNFAEAYSLHNKLK